MIQERHFIVESDELFDPDHPQNLKTCSGTATRRSRSLNRHNRPRDLEKILNLHKTKLDSKLKTTSGIAKRYAMACEQSQAVDYRAILRGGGVNRLQICELKIQNDGGDCDKRTGIKYSGDTPRLGTIVQCVHGCWNKTQFPGANAKKA